MDDIVVLARDENEGKERLGIVLQTAADYGLRLRWKKCQLLRTRFEYLGYEMGNEHVKPSNRKTEVIRNYPMPNTLRRLHSFLGLTSYFRKFVPNYSRIAKPLTDLFRTGAKFEMKEAQQASFQLLRDALVKHPVLSI